MKHFDRTKAKTAAQPCQSSVDLSVLLHAAKTRPLAQAIIDSLGPGLIFCDARGGPEMANAQAAALLDLERIGADIPDWKSELMRLAENSGDLKPERKSEAEKQIAARVAVRFQLTTSTGRILMADIHPRPDGGHTIMLTDVTAFRRREESLAADKARAEKMERKLGVELARLNLEKARVESRQEELQRLSLVAAHAKDLIVITDPTNRIVWVNEAFRRHNGLDPEMDLLGRSGRDVLSGPESDPEKLSLIDEAVRNRQSVTLELICHRRNGPPYWMEQEIIPVFNDVGAHTNFIIVGRDVSDRKHAEAAAAEARRFEEMKRTESRMLAEFNEWLQSSDTLDELFIVVSSFLSKLLPGSSGAVYTYGAARDVLQRACAWGESRQIEEFEPSDCWALRRGRPYFHGDNTIDIACDHVMAGRVGPPPVRQYCLPIIAHGDTVGLLSVELDITAGLDTQKLVNFCAEHISLAIANVKMRDLLREQSTRDPLTGLYNRRFFLDYARRELTRCAAQSKPAALISLDVDHFKAFNDNHGHEAGDSVLKALAGVLQAMFRQADVSCRLGGEEFVVMLPGCGAERAMERAEQLRQAIEAMQLRHRSEVLNVTVSAGLAVLTEASESLQELLHRADEALYSAKASGRNRVMAAT
ncbi:MAG: diguanylate cyclase [Paracoccaceae bacterium]